MLQDFAIFHPIQYISYFPNQNLNQKAMKPQKGLMALLVSVMSYSTVTDLARFLGLSTSVPRVMAA